MQKKHITTVKLDITLRSNSYKISKFCSHYGYYIMDGGITRLISKHRVGPFCGMRTIEIPTFQFKSFTSLVAVFFYNHDEEGETIINITASQSNCFNLINPCTMLNRMCQHQMHQMYIRMTKECWYSSYFYIYYTVVSKIY